MRRLFSRMSGDEGKAEKGEDKKSSKAPKLKRSIFGKSQGNNETSPRTSNSTLHDLIKIQIDSCSPSSTPSTPPYANTPSASSSFSSITTVTEAPSVSSSVSPALSLSRSPDSTQSVSSNSSGSRPTSSASKSSSNNGQKNSRKTPSPLSTQVDAHSLPTPPPSPSLGCNQHEDCQPKRLNSIYNLFRKAQSQPELSPSTPSSRSNSTTTLPSTCTIPHMPSALLVPPSPPSRRHSKALNKKSSSSSLIDEPPVVGSNDGLLSTNPSIAHRAILMGDPLGGGSYLYPTARKLAPPSVTPRMMDRSGRGGRRSHYGRASNNYSQDWKRSSWAGPSNGDPRVAWRKPRINRMIIEEEQNDSGEQHRRPQNAGHHRIGRGGFIEDTPAFTDVCNSEIVRRPQSPSKRSNSALGYYNPPSQRPVHYPPFAPPPCLPPISQFLEPPAPAVRA